MENCSAALGFGISGPDFSLKNSLPGASYWPAEPAWPRKETVAWNGLSLNLALGSAGPAPDLGQKWAGTSPEWAAVRGQMGRGVEASTLRILGRVQLPCVAGRCQSRRGEKKSVVANLVIKTAN